MKFIHTADWHLGNKMHGIDRQQENQSFLIWLKDEIIKNKIDTLIVSGDIFDTANPPVESRKQYNDFLASLLNTECRNIIITAGNHDSPALLDSQKEILEPLNIHIVGSISNCNLNDIVYELKDVQGNVEAVCAAVPFVRENELRDFVDEDTEDGTFSDRANENLYKDVLEECKKVRGDLDIPLIATGHLYACDLEGRFDGEVKDAAADDGVRTLDVVGKLGSVHVKTFPCEFDYIALGHIHYATMVAKNSRIRYSGSPFVMGFDEANIPHYVLVGEFGSDRELTIQKIKVPDFNDYKRVAGDFETIKTELLKYEKSSRENNLYVEVYYKKEDDINISEELDKMVEELQDNNIYIISRRLQNVINRSVTDFDAEEVKNLEPKEIFTRLIASRNKVLTEDKTEEDSYIDKYLPLFMESYNEFLNGNSNENN